MKKPSVRGEEFKNTPGAGKSRITLVSGVCGPEKLPDRVL